MNKEYIIDTVEKIINGQNSDFDFCMADFGDSAIERFYKNTVIRLLNILNSSACTEQYSTSVLVAIRNFMLVFKSSLAITAIAIPKNNKCGLYFDENTSKYYAVYDIPNYVKNPSFIEEAFIADSDVEYVTDERYCLDTNRFIRSITGFTRYKSLEQKLCVLGSLNTPDGFTTLVSMPTGGGKSLVTQAVAYENRGLTIVIVPTVSLAIDQERSARENIKCCTDSEIFAYYSGVKNQKDIFDAIEQQKARLLFISPEALIKNKAFKELIGKANASRYLRNIIIDEAHIVVAWGDFFRVDYQCLNPWRNELLTINPSIRTYLLSATYKEETVKALKRMFSNGEDWIEIRCDSMRKEPRFILDKLDNSFTKRRHVDDYLFVLPRPMIIYVSAPYEAELWKKHIEELGFENVKTFTGDTKSDERSILIDEWTKNKFDIMIATSAFGVGVDKPDVRSVLHLYVPDNPDAYYQELGRGGRDGLPCLSVMCIDKEDIDNGSDHITKVLKPDTLWGRWWSMYTNPSNQWFDGSIAIMASTKPRYNRVYSFEEGNETDEKWNINVLLLLNRHRQIDIVGLDLDESNRYIFTINILNDLLMSESAESKDLIERIRTKEADQAQSAFKLMKNSIDKADSVCWSEMFYETYSRVSEYCSGCNSHSEKIHEEKNRFPLLSDVTKPEKKLTNKQLSFFGSTKEALVISNAQIIELINKYTPDIVVCDTAIDLDKVDNSMVNLMSFDELRDLMMHDNGFYISGVILIAYSIVEETARKQYRIIRNYCKNDKYLIHLSTTDFLISSSTEKHLSSSISGAVIRD